MYHATILPENESGSKCTVHLTRFFLKNQNGLFLLFCPCWQGIYGVSLLQKNRVVKNICDFLQIYIFRVVSREGREWGEGWEKENREIRQIREQEFQPEQFNRR